MPYELPNDLRLRIWENWNISVKFLHSVELLPSAYSSSWNENFVSTNKNLLKNRNWTFAIARYFTWKLEFSSNTWWMIVSEKSFFTSSLPQAPSNLMCLTTFVTLRLLTHFKKLSLSFHWGQNLILNAFQDSSRMLF